MNRKISAMVPGAMNEGQYHFGYQTPDRSSDAAGASRRPLRRPRVSSPCCCSTAADVSVAISGTSLDLGPCVEPYLVDLWRQLVRREVLLEHVLGHDRRRQRLGDDPLLHQRVGLDRGEGRLVAVPLAEVLGVFLLVEH